MRIPQEYANIQLREFSQQTMQCVDECRQTVGHREDHDWECPYLGDAEHQEAFRAQYSEKYVGGFLCYPCFIKDMKNRSTSKS